MLHVTPPDNFYKPPQMSTENRVVVVVDMNKDEFEIHYLELKVGYAVIIVPPEADSSLPRKRGIVSIMHHSLRMEQGDNEVWVPCTAVNIDLYQESQQGSLYATYPEARKHMIIEYNHLKYNPGIPPVKGDMSDYMFYGEHYGSGLLHKLTFEIVTAELPDADLLKPPVAGAPKQPKWARVKHTGDGIRRIFFELYKMPKRAFSIQVPHKFLVPTILDIGDVVRRTSDETNTTGLVVHVVSINVDRWESVYAVKGCGHGNIKEYRRRDLISTGKSQAMPLV